MKKILTIIILLALIVSVNTATAQVNNSKILIQKVQQFYSWYKVHYEEMNNFKLYKGSNENDAPPYTIQWKTVEKYFTFIRTKLPLLGEDFISWHRKDFKRIEEIYQKYPEEEIVIGFDFDRIVGGQEDVVGVIDYSFPKKSKWKVAINGNTAIVTCVFEALDYETNTIIEATSNTELKKEKGTWKISRTLGMMEIDALRKEKIKDMGTTI
jgi:hypothetical protein